MLGITPERARQIWFSIPYAEEAAVLVGPGSLEVKTPADLAGKRIGIPRGAMQDIVLTQNPPRGPRSCASTTKRPPCRHSSPDRSSSRARGCCSFASSTATTPARTTRPSWYCARSISAWGSGAATRTCCNGSNTFVYAIRANGELDAISKKWREMPLGRAADASEPRANGADHCRWHAHAEARAGHGSAPWRGRAGRYRDGARTGLSPSRYGRDVHQRSGGRRRHRRLRRAPGRGPRDHEGIAGSPPP